jgi:hypothetical protein
VRVDELELLVLGHRVGDRAGAFEQRRLGAERPGGGEPREEPRRALEQRREGGGTRGVVQAVEGRQRDERRGHEPR